MLEIGSMVKGKDLENRILCKVVTEDLNMRGFQYRLGMNEDTQPLATEGSCEAGLHFAEIGNICDFLNYGTKLAIVSVPDEEPVYVDDGKLRSHRLLIESVMDLWAIDTWQYLHKHGANITAGDNEAVIWAAKRGHLEIVQYLCENGADITTWNNEAVRYAAGNDHLEIVQYLHKNGADITAQDNEAVRLAAENGHLDVVKYLHEHGADITAWDNAAVRWAAGNGHLEIVQYLHKNGADITARNNRAVRCAKINGHQEVIDYLLANGAKLDN